MPQVQDVTVLVVDDEPNVRDYLAQILRDAGFKVVTASDGGEALDIIRAQPPDFISLDLIMPRKSGHKLLFELKRDKELSRIPVLVVRCLSGLRYLRIDLSPACYQQKRIG